MPSCAQIADSFTSNKPQVFVIFSYTLLWIGFIIWAFMGSFWATVEIRGSAFTYFGLHRVCDEREPHDKHSAYDVIGIQNDVFMGANRVGYFSNVSSSDAQSNDDGWYNCYHTLTYIQVNEGEFHNTLLMGWNCCSIFASAWCIFIAIANLFFCCSHNNDQSRQRIVMLLAAASSVLVLMLVLSLVTFTNGFDQYMLYNFASNTSSKTLISGVEYQYEMSYYLTITITIFFAFGGLLAWIAVSLMKYDHWVESRVHNTPARARWGDVELRVRPARS